MISSLLSFNNSIILVKGIIDQEVREIFIEWDSKIIAHINGSFVLIALL